jgi:Putative DNA-binding domain
MSKADNIAGSICATADRQTKGARHMFFPHDLSQINEGHIKALIEAQAEETAYREFKRQLPTFDNDGKKEFLADVSSFANSSGGELIYGIEEDDEGHASMIVPLTGSRDDVSLRLESILKDNIEPRIPGLRIHAVDVEGGFVLIIGIPQSWAGPHRIRSNQHFYSRENRSKRQLDIPEIRALFLRSERQAQHIREFRTERLGKILSGETPRPLVRGPALVIHFIPTQAALGLMQIDPTAYMNGRGLWVMGASGWDSTLNADGVLAYRVVQKEGAYGYSLLFRNGFFEGVSVLGAFESDSIYLPSQSYEEEIINLLGFLRRELDHLGFGKEMTAMLSILGADHVRLATDRRFYGREGLGRFDRKSLVLPDVLLRSEVPPHTALRPLFDLVWQSAGYLRSYNYDDAGNWAVR